MNDQQPMVIKVHLHADIYAHI